MVIFSLDPEIQNIINGVIRHSEMEYFYQELGHVMKFHGQSSIAHSQHQSSNLIGQKCAGFSITQRMVLWMGVLNENKNVSSDKTYHTKTPTNTDFRYTPTCMVGGRQPNLFAASLEPC